MDNIVESRWLRESTQLRNFLRHVVEETLAGRTGGLKEYALGREVFNRPPDYDPRSDAIVRVQASTLRKRLAAYYEHEGRTSTIRIELPPGGYQPVFVDVAGFGETEPLRAVEELPGPPPRPQARFNWTSFACGLPAGVLLTVMAVLIVQHKEPRPVPGTAIWGPILEAGASTVVSYGVPLFYAGSGIFVRDTRVNSQGEESKGTLGRISKLLGEPIRVQEDVYTGIVQHQEPRPVPGT